MFSSNQELKISGPLNYDDLKCALTFCLHKSGYTPTCFQVSKNKVFGLGWCDTATGWNPLSIGGLKIDEATTVGIILNFLKGLSLEFPSNYDDEDGSSERGFIITSFDESFPSILKDEFLSPQYGIIKISPFTCFYHK